MSKIEELRAKVEQKSNIIKQFCELYDLQTSKQAVEIKKLKAESKQKDEIIKQLKDLIKFQQANGNGWEI